MRRREFIGSMIGTAVAWPLTVRAQQSAKVYRLAIVSSAGPVFVDSLARPGGNITGVSDYVADIWGKRLGLLRELIPAAHRMGFLSSRGLVPRSPMWVGVQEAAQQAGITLISPPLEGTVQEAEYRRVFERMTQERAEALIVGTQSEHNSYGRLIIELAEKSRLPAIYPNRFFAEQGGLITYGIDYVDLYRRAAGYIARILKGARPGEQPIDQATKFELVINLKAAKTLGLTVPQILLAGAEEVIE